MSPSVVRRLWLLALVGAASGGVACSSSGTGNASGDAGGVSSSSSGGSSGSSSSSGGSSSGGTTHGEVVVAQSAPTDGGAATGTLTATFGERDAGGPTCAVTTSGPCQIQDCTAVLADDASTPVDVSAGNVTLSGGKLPAPVTLSFADGGYTSAFEMTQLFAPGDVFQVTATGDTVPAFSGTTPPAPGPITLTSPSPVGTELGSPVYPIDLTKSATFSWSGGATGAKTLVSVTNLDTNVIVVCSFDAAAGTGTIPADAVAKFPSATTTIPQPLTFTTLVTSTVAGGDVSLVVETGAPAFFTTE
ncbi:MAG TPA: hypothetical protein VF765_37005 [Polyangiaceae bacterium]